MKDSRLREVWLKADPPVIFRRNGSKPLLVRLRYFPDNFRWLRDEKRHKPNWNCRYKCWGTPVAWYDWLAGCLLKRFGATYLIQLYREQQKRAPACWNAQELHCEHSCMGEKHGSGQPDGFWQEISETFAFKWGPKRYACRLLLLPKSKQVV